MQSALHHLAGTAAGAARRLAAAGLLRRLAGGAAALALSGCALVGGEPDVAAEADPALAERDARIAALESEVRTVRSENEKLSRRLAELQKDSRAAPGAENPPPPALKDDAVRPLAAAPPGTAPEIRPETVIAAADASAALASSPAKPVDPAPRLVQPTFASKEEIFENEAGDAIRTASVLFGVHLASYRHEAEARTGWVKLQQDFPDELGLLEPRLERVDIEGRGEFLRLVGGAFASEAKASALCERLRAKSAYCAVARFAGEKLLRDEPALR